MPGVKPHWSRACPVSGASRERAPPASGFVYEGSVAVVTLGTAPYRSVRDHRRWRGRPTPPSKSHLASSYLGVVTTAGASRTHRHGTRVHAHPYVGPHRHVRHGFRRSAPVDGVAHAHTHGEHGHSHGLIDDSIKRSRDGIRAVSLSLGVLGLTALAQTAVFLASGSIALLADLIHNFGDALTAVPLGIAFALHSQVAERRAGLAVVGAIFISACVAGIEAVQRLIHPSPPTHLLVLAVAGAIGYAGNFVAARIRLAAGRRLDSATLIADGHHARADAYVSLAVIGSAVVVGLGAPIADPLIGLGITFVILRITWQSWETVRGHRSH
jgi:hypothetical protein